MIDAATERSFLSRKRLQSTKEKEREKEERKRKAAATPVKVPTPLSAAKNSGSRSSSRIKRIDPDSTDCGIMDLAAESDEEDIVVVKKGKR